MTLRRHATRGVRSAVLSILGVGGCAGSEPARTTSTTTIGQTAAPSEPAHVETFSAQPVASSPIAPSPRLDVPMVKIKRGSFTMGCPPAAATVCEADEKPAHGVELSPYEIDVYEVTTGQYMACVNAKACPPVTHARKDALCHDQFQPEYNKRPVVCMAAEHATAYCKWRGKRLPTEAEWERAARGDRQSPDGGERLYPWGDQTPNEDRACVRANSPCDVGTHPEGVSAYGLHDMAGNAAEWVWDYYDPQFYASSPARDPDGTWDLLPIHRRGCQAATCNTARGGSFRDELAELRATARTAKAPADGSKFTAFGFRCARSTEASRRAYFANRVNIWNAKRIQESTGHP